MLSLAAFVGVLIGGFYLQGFLAYQAGQSYEITEVQTYHSPAPQVLGAAATKLNGTAKLQDWRAYVLDEYFRAHESPLYGTGDIFVAACNEFGAPADCLTVAAIADAETDLCKYGGSHLYYNCWGFGGGGEYRMYFSSWDESIRRVTDVLVNQYGREYMIDPSLMERTFCGWEPGCTNWGNRVKYFMTEISNYALQLGFEQPLISAR